MNCTVNGLNVNTFGDANKQPVIFVHGFPFDYYMWGEQIEVLKDDYYCVAYDVRGLGQSIVDDGQFTLEMCVDDLFAIIDELKLKKSFLCGLSMGGYISLRAVERDQSKFKGLILCDTRSDADDNEGKLKRTKTIKQINAGEISNFVETFVSGLFADMTKEENPELVKDTIERCKTSDPVGVKGTTIAIMSRTDTTPSLSRINIPTLVLCGSLDTLTPPVMMRELAEEIKDSEYATIPRAGHLAPLENAECVNDLIIDFLKRV
jgi:3-oxoadipate enol-lactonase